MDTSIFRLTSDYPARKSDFIVVRMAPEDLHIGKIYSVSRHHEAREWRHLTADPAVLLSSPTPLPKDLVAWHIEHRMMYVIPALKSVQSRFITENHDDPSQPVSFPSLDAILDVIHPFLELG